MIYIYINPKDNSVHQSSTSPDEGDQVEVSDGRLIVLRIRASPIIDIERLNFEGSWYSTTLC